MPGKEPHQLGPGVSGGANHPGDHHNLLEPETRHLQTNVYSEFFVGLLNTSTEAGKGIIVPRRGTNRGTAHIVHIVYFA
jgi:hypothetical protein